MSVKRGLLAIVIVLAVFGTSVTSNDHQPLPLRLTQARASVDATSAWNACCTTWGFPYAPGAPTASFASHWNLVNGHTLTLKQSLAGITADINVILGSGSPPPGGDDTLNYTLQNWGN